MIPDYSCHPAKRNIINSKKLINGNNFIFKFMESRTPQWTITVMS